MEGSGSVRVHSNQEQPLMSFSVNFVSPGVHNVPVSLGWPVTERLFTEEKAVVPRVTHDLEVSQPIRIRTETEFHPVLVRALLLWRDTRAKVTLTKETLDWGRLALPRFSPSQSWGMGHGGVLAEVALEKELSSTPGSTRRKREREPLSLAQAQAFEIAKPPPLHPQW